MQFSNDQEELKHSFASSQQITEEIKQSMGSDELKEDVLEVLFTSFVIQ